MAEAEAAAAAEVALLLLLPLFYERPEGGKPQRLLRL